VWITESSCSINVHSEGLIGAIEHQSSLVYWRAVLKSWSSNLAAKSESLNLIWQVSIAKGEPYFGIKIFTFYPSQRQEIYSAWAFVKPKPTLPQALHNSLEGGLPNILAIQPFLFDEKLGETGFYLISFLIHLPWTGIGNSTGYNDRLHHQYSKPRSLAFSATICRTFFHCCFAIWDGCRPHVCCRSKCFLKIALRDFELEYWCYCINMLDSLKAVIVNSV